MATNPNRLNVTEFDFDSVKENLKILDEFIQDDYLKKKQKQLILYYF